MRALLLFLLLTAASSGMAEIYKWTDDQGRVHFGDKPTDRKIRTQEVQVKDYAPGTDDATRAINERRRRLMDAGTAESQAQQKAQQSSAQREETEARKRCAEARTRLTEISGPVVFIDENGNEVRTTERERLARHKELQAWVLSNCN